MARILIADDDFAIGMEIEEMLIALGHDVVGQAGSGLEAVKMARDLKPDIILMDIVMPGKMNGIEAAVEIKAESDIPIIFISAYGDPEHIEKAKEIEPFGYVMKPFDEKEVRAFVEIALHKKKIEKELIETRRRLQYLLTSSPAVIYTCEPGGDYRTTFMSETVKGQLGYEPQEFLNDPGFWAKHVHPEDSARVFEGLSHLFEEDSHIHEYRFQHKDGSYRWMRDDLRLMLDPGGNPAEIVGCWIDIDDRKQAEENLQKAHNELEERVRERTEKLTKATEELKEEIKERKQVEEALRQSEEKYRNIFNNAQVGIYRTRISDGKVLECNTRFARTHGYKTAEECIADLVVSEVYTDEGTREKMLASIMEKGAVSDLEACFSRKDGDDVCIRFSARAYPEKGYMEGVGYDITEEKRALDALRESEERFKAIFEGSRDAIFITAQDTRFAFVNPAACALTGYSEEELLRMRIPDLHSPGQLHAFDQIFGSLMAGKARITEADIVRKDGVKVPTEFSSTRLAVGDRVFLHTVARDVTERKQAEEALRKGESMRKALFRAAPVGIAFVKDRTFIKVNKEYCDIVGYNEEELIGKTTLMLYKNEDENARVGAELYTHLWDQGLTHIETHHLRKDGMIRDVMLRAAPVSQDDSSAGAVVAIVDLTDMKLGVKSAVDRYSVIW